MHSCRPLVIFTLMRTPQNIFKFYAQITTITLKAHDQKVAGNQTQNVLWITDGGKPRCSLPYHELGLYELILSLLPLSRDLRATEERLCQELWDEHKNHLPNLHLEVGGKKKEKRKQRNNLCIQILLSERRNKITDQQVYAQDAIQMSYFFILFVGPRPTTFKFSALLILNRLFGFFSFEEKAFLLPQTMVFCSSNIQPRDIPHLPIPWQSLSQCSRNRPQE